MANQKTGNERQLGILLLLLIVSSLVLFGIAAAAKTEVLVYLGLILLLLGGIPVWLIIAGFSQRYNDLEKRIDELQSRRQ